MISELDQADIDFLDRLANMTRCTVCLPPFKNKNHVFIDVNLVRYSESLIENISMALMEYGFSFVFDEDGFIEILGVTHGTAKL